MTTQLLINAPQENETTGIRMRSSAQWTITWNDDGELNRGQTSVGLLPDHNLTTNKDNVILALAKEVHELRQQVAQRQTAPTGDSPDGEEIGAQYGDRRVYYRPEDRFLAIYNDRYDRREIAFLTSEGVEQLHAATAPEDYVPAAAVSPSGSTVTFGCYSVHGAPGEVRNARGNPAVLVGESNRQNIITAFRSAAAQVRELRTQVDELQEHANTPNATPDLPWPPPRLPRPSDAVDWAWVAEDFPVMPPPAVTDRQPALSEELADWERDLLGRLP